MKIVKTRAGLMILFVLGVSVLASCGKPTQKFDASAYRQEVEQWQRQRGVRLSSEDGWLTLCGLFWLKEGENKFGDDSSNAVVFPKGKTPRTAGSIWLDHGKLHLVARPKAHVKYRDSVVTNMAINSDDAGVADPTILNMGTLSFYVIKRGDQYGVRMKDKQNPARLNFKGLEYFPVDPKWRIEAKFEPYVPPKILKIASVVGTVEDDSCPGAIVFDIDGTSLRLDAVIEKGSEDQLFIMFSDETSGKETYGMGRQLYSGLPDHDGNVILDFNKAYNWPCVFTEFATCPIPPRQNHLPVRVEAGEKMYAGH